MSFQKFLFVIVVFVFIIAIISGEISFDFWKENYSYGDIRFNIKNLKNITWELYTSPDNSWYAFNDSISHINHILKIETYEFTEKRLKRSFKKLLEKWIDIKLIMENNKYQQFQNTRKKIKEYFQDYNNFEIKSDEQMHTKYVHSKINLVDSGFWIQTANLTYSSFNKNREYFFYSTDTWVWNSLNIIFDKDWIWKKIEIEDIHPNLLVCNINCRNWVESLLQNAKNSIIIQTQYIVDKSIFNILKNKSNNGVKLKFIVSDTEYNNNLLRYFWPWIARKFDKYYNHTKMILIDNKYLVLWSMNLSDNSLDKNREIWIILIDKDTISEFKELFDKDWEKSIFDI